MDELLQFWDSKETGTGGETKIEYLAEGPLQWARVWWAGTDEDEATVQKLTGATLRCLPIASDPQGNGAGEWGECVSTGQPTQTIAIFAKAYQLASIHSTNRV